MEQAQVRFWMNQQDTLDLLLSFPLQILFNFNTMMLKTIKSISTTIALFKYIFLDKNDDLYIFPIFLDALASLIRSILFSHSLSD